MKIILMICITLAFNICFSQLTFEAKNFPFISGTTSSTTYGIYFTGKLDTVRAVLLISECDDCPTKTISSYAVRQEMILYAESFWHEVSYLDKQRKPFLKTVIIWQSKLK